MGNTEVMVPVMEASGLQAKHQDSLPLEQEMVITETCEAENSKTPQKRKRGRPPKSAVKMPMGLLQGSSRTSEVENHDESSDASNPAVVNTREATEYQQEWPFIKRSPIWSTIESLELYQNPPQKPHFLLLKKIKEDYREGLAIGHMVTFANVVQKTSKLQPDDPNDIIDNSLETLVDLETHGFDVCAVRARLNELLSRKAQLGELNDKLKEAEKEVEKQNLEKSKIDEEINEIEAKIKELEEKVVECVKKKNLKNEEIMMLQSDMNLVGNQILDLKVDFGKLAATPF